MQLQDVQTRLFAVELHLENSQRNSNANANEVVQASLVFRLFLFNCFSSHNFSHQNQSTMNKLVQAMGSVTMILNLS
jgi:hypothetical protein